MKEAREHFTGKIVNCDGCCDLVSFLKVAIIRRYAALSFIHVSPAPILCAGLALDCRKENQSASAYYTELTQKNKKQGKPRNETTTIVEGLG